MEERKAFSFYRSYYDVAKELPKAARLDYLMAILNYQFTGEEDELKGMAKFAYMSQKHSIDRQLEGYKHGKKGGSPPKGNDNPPPKGSDNQEKGEEEEKGKGQQVKKPKFNFKQSLLDLNVDVDVVNDWLMVREKGKAVNTETSFKTIKSQIEKSGKSANECVKLCVVKSWKGFNASWLANVDDVDMSERKKLNAKLKYATPKEMLPHFDNEQSMNDSLQSNTYVSNGEKIFPLRAKDGTRNKEGDYIIGIDKQLHKITV